VRDYEHQSQKAVFSWAAMQAKADPRLGLLLAIPNGGHRHPRVAGKLKAEGVKRGVPDILLPVSNPEHNALWIEMKTATGRVSSDQQWWLERLSKAGSKAIVCRSAGDAINEIQTYLKNEK